MQGDVFRKPRHAWEAQNALRSTYSSTQGRECKDNNNYKVGLDPSTGLLKDTYSLRYEANIRAFTRRRRVQNQGQYSMGSSGVIGYDYMHGTLKHFIL